MLLVAGRGWRRRFWIRGGFVALCLEWVESEWRVGFRGGRIVRRRCIGRWKPGWRSFGFLVFSLVGLEGVAVDPARCLSRGWGRTS